MNNAEITAAINSLFNKQIHLCKTCIFVKCCGHTEGHIQDGCLRFYEKKKEKYGNTAFFIDFKITDGKIKQIGNYHFSFDYVVDYENKTGIENEILQAQRNRAKELDTLHMKKCLLDYARKDRRQ